MPLTNALGHLQSEEVRILAQETINKEIQEGI